MRFDRGGVMKSVALVIVCVAVWAVNIWLVIDQLSK